jgi:PAS domain S-box-containing protein
MTLTDLQGDFLLVSSAFAKYVGKSVNEIKGHPLELFFSGDSLNLLQNADVCIKASRLPLEHDESFPIQFGDSILQVSKFPVLNDLGELTAIATIGVDVTRAVNNERQLFRA